MLDGVKTSSNSSRAITFNFRLIYHRKGMNTLMTSKYGLNRITSVILLGLLWDPITINGWYVIKQRKPPKPNASYNLYDYINERKEEREIEREESFYIMYSLYNVKWYINHFTFFSGHDECTHTHAHILISLCLSLYLVQCIFYLKTKINQSSSVVHHWCYSASLCVTCLEMDWVGVCLSQNQRRNIDWKTPKWFKSFQNTERKLIWNHKYV